MLPMLSTQHMADLIGLLLTESMQSSKQCIVSPDLISRYVTKRIPERILLGSGMIVFFMVSSWEKLAAKPARCLLYSTRKSSKSQWQKTQK
jgi:hypothetical protein